MLWDLTGLPPMVVALSSGRCGYAAELCFHWRMPCACRHIMHSAALPLLTTAQMSVKQALAGFHEQASDLGVEREQCAARMACFPSLSVQIHCGSPCAASPPSVHTLADCATGSASAAAADAFELQALHIRAVSAPRRRSVCSCTAALQTMSARITLSAALSGVRAKAVGCRSDLQRRPRPAGGGGQAVLQRRGAAGLRRAGQLRGGQRRAGRLGARGAGAGVVPNN